MYGHDFTYQNENKKQKKYGIDMARHTQTKYEGKKEKTGNIDTRHLSFLFPRRKRLETLNGCYNKI